MSVLLTRQGPLLKVNAVLSRAEGVTVLDRLSVTVEVGERVGPGGAGKTALFDVVTGLARAEAGSIWYDGRPLFGLKPDRILRLGIGRSFQRARPPWPPGAATVRKAVGLAAAAALGIGIGPALAPLRRRSRAAAGRRERIARMVDDALERTVLTPWADAPPGALPRARRAYLDIARALAPGPQLLLLDEPAVGPDPADREAFAAFLRRLDADGLTVVLAAHDAALVGALCPRVVVLHRGRRIADGPPERVGASPEVLHAFAGDPAASAAA